MDEPVKPTIKHRFPVYIRIISAILVISFLAYDISWAYPDKLQVELRTTRPDFKLAFDVKYRVEKARRIAELIDSKNPTSLGDIAKWEGASDREFSGTSFEKNPGEIIIKIDNGDIVLRYYINKNAREESPPQDFVSASYWGLDRPYENRYLYRQLLLTQALHDKLISNVKALPQTPQDSPAKDIAQYKKRILKARDVVTVSGAVSELRKTALDGNIEEDISNAAVYAFGDVLKEPRVPGDTKDVCILALQTIAAYGRPNVARSAVNKVGEALRAKEASGRTRYGCAKALSSIATNMPSSPEIAKSALEDLGKAFNPGVSDEAKRIASNEIVTVAVRGSLDIAESALTILDQTIHSPDVSDYDAYLCCSALKTIATTKRQSLIGQTALNLLIHTLSSNLRDTIKSTCTDALNDVVKEAPSAIAGYYLNRDALEAVNGLLIGQDLTSLSPGAQTLLKLRLYRTLREEPDSRIDINEEIERLKSEEGSLGRAREDHMISLIVDTWLFGTGQEFPIALALFAYSLDVHANIGREYGLNTYEIVATLGRLVLPTLESHSPRIQADILGEIERISELEGFKIFTTTKIDEQGRARAYDFSSRIQSVDFPGRLPLEEGRFINAVGFANNLVLADRLSRESDSPEEDFDRITNIMRLPIEDFIGYITGPETDYIRTGFFDTPLISTNVVEVEGVIEDMRSRNFRDKYYLTLVLRAYLDRQETPMERALAGLWTQFTNDMREVLAGDIDIRSRIYEDLRLAQNISDISDRYVSMIELVLTEDESRIESVIMEFFSLSVPLDKDKVYPLLLLAASGNEVVTRALKAGVALGKNPELQETLRSQAWLRSLLEERGLFTERPNPGGETTLSGIMKPDDVVNRIVEAVRKTAAIGPIFTLLRYNQNALDPNILAQIKKRLNDSELKRLYKAIGVLLTRPIKELPPQKEGTDRYKMVMICNSNLFRGPMASYLVHELIKDMHLRNRFEVVSRGLNVGFNQIMIPNYGDEVQRTKNVIEANLSPLLSAQEPDEKYGDLRGIITDYIYYLFNEHTPQDLSREEVENASAIFVASPRQREELWRRFSDIKGLEARTFLITQLLDPADEWSCQRIPDIKSKKNPGGINARELFELLHHIVDEGARPKLEALAGPSKAAKPQPPKPESPDMEIRKSEGPDFNTEDGVRKYDEWFDRYRLAYFTQLEAIKKAMPEGGRGLEIGVGTGRHASALGIKFGIDPSPEMIKVARERGIDARLGKGEDLPFRDKEFDFCLIANTLNFVDDPEKVLQEARRVTRDGGRIILGIINKGSWLLDKTRLDDQKLFTAQEVVELLRSQGFSNIRTWQTFCVELPEDISWIDDIEEGHDKGVFVVISAEKPLGIEDKITILEEEYRKYYKERHGLPYEPSGFTENGFFQGTPLNYAEDLLREIKVGPGMKFLDLGSGDGRMGFVAAILGAHATLIEDNEGLANISREIQKTLEERGVIAPGSVEIIHGNFLDDKYDLARYGAIYYYDRGTNDKNKKRLDEKLTKEMSADARLLVFREVTTKPFRRLKIDRHVLLDYEVPGSNLETRVYVKEPRPAPSDNIRVSKHPLIYEINTRALNKKFSEISDDELKELKATGAEVVWFMGVWEESPYSERLNAYWGDKENQKRRASVYAVKDYKISRLLGGESEFNDIVMRANRLGLKVMIDIVPNHMALDHDLMLEHPEFFMQPGKDVIEKNKQWMELNPKDGWCPIFRDPRTGNVFYFGKDPNWPRWGDTVQFDYLNREMRQYLKDTILRIADLTNGGGIRFDVVWLTLRENIRNNWFGHLSLEEFDRVYPKEDEFWKNMIPELKKRYPGIVLLAEAYEGYGVQLAELGFDFYYEKRCFFDAFLEKDVRRIKDFLNIMWCDKRYNFVKFLENHDTFVRIRHALGDKAAEAAAVLLYTLPGASLIYHDQEKGHSLWSPSANFIDGPKEKDDPVTMEFYRNLAGITSKAVFRDGDFKLLDLKSVQSMSPAMAKLSWFSGKPSAGNINDVIAFERTYQDERAVVVVNYSGAPADFLVEVDGKISEYHLPPWGYRISPALAPKPESPDMEISKGPEETAKDYSKIDWSRKGNTEEKKAAIRWAVSELKKETGKEFVKLGLVAKRLGIDAMTLSYFFSRTLKVSAAYYDIKPARLTIDIVKMITDRMRQGEPHRILLQGEVEDFAGLGQGVVRKWANKASSEGIEPGIFLAREFGIFAAYEDEKTNEIRREWAKKHLEENGIPYTEGALREAMSIVKRGEDLEIAMRSKEEILNFYNQYKRTHGDESPSAEEIGEHFGVSKPVAYKWVRSLQQQEVDIKTRAIGEAVKAKTKAKLPSAEDLQAFCDRYQNIYGMPPSMEEIAEKFNVSKKSITELKENGVADIKTRGMMGIFHKPILKRNVKSVPKFVEDMEEQLNHFASILYKVYEKEGDEGVREYIQNIIERIKTLAVNHENPNDISALSELISRLKGRFIGFLAWLKSLHKGLDPDITSGIKDEIGSVMAILQKISKRLLDIEEKDLEKRIKGGSEEEIARFKEEPLPEDIEDIDEEKPESPDMAKAVYGGFNNDISDGDTANPFILEHIDNGRAIEVDEEREAVHKIRRNRSNPRAPPLESAYRLNGTFDKIRRAKERALLENILIQSRTFRNYTPQQKESLITIVQDTPLILILANVAIGETEDRSKIAHVRTGYSKTIHGLGPTIWIGEILFKRLSVEQLAEFLLEEAQHILRPPKRVNGRWINLHRTNASQDPGEVIEHSDEFMRSLDTGPATEEELAGERETFARIGVKYELILTQQNIENKDAIVNEMIDAMEKLGYSESARRAFMYFFYEILENARKAIGSVKLVQDYESFENLWKRVQDPAMRKKLIIKYITEGRNKTILKLVWLLTPEKVTFRLMNNCEPGRYLEDRIEKSYQGNVEYSNEDLEKIGEPDSILGTPLSGVKLGIALTRRLAQDADGDIYYDIGKTEKGWTTFRIELPLKISLPSKDRMLKEEAALKTAKRITVLETELTNIANSMEELLKAMDLKHYLSIGASGAIIKNKLTGFGSLDLTSGLGKAALRAFRNLLSDIIKTAKDESVPDSLLEDFKKATTKASWLIKELQQSKQGLAAIEHELGMKVEEMAKDVKKRAAVPPAIRSEPEVKKPTPVTEEPGPEEVRQLVDNYLKQRGLESNSEEAKESGDKKRLPPKPESPDMEKPIPEKEPGPVGSLIVGSQLKPDASAMDIDRVLLAVIGSSNDRLKKILGFNRRQRQDIANEMPLSIDALLKIKGIGAKTIENARRKIMLGSGCFDKYKDGLSGFETLALDIRRDDTEDVVAKKAGDTFSEYRHILRDRDFLDSISIYFENDPEILLSLTYIIWLEIRAGPKEEVQPAIETLLKLAKVRKGLELPYIIPYYKLKAIEYLGRLDVKKAIPVIMVPLAYYPKRDEFYDTAFQALVNLAKEGSLGSFYAFIKPKVAVPLAKLAVEVVAQARPERDSGKSFLEQAKAQRKESEIQMVIRTVQRSAEEQAAQAFGEFAKTCRDNMQLIHEAVESGQGDIAQYEAEIFDSIGHEFKSPVLEGLGRLMRDSMQDLFAIRMLLSDRNKVFDKKKIFAALDDLEKVLQQFEMLIKGGSLMRAEDARISSGVIDASRVLIPQLLGFIRSQEVSGLATISVPEGKNILLSQNLFDEVEDLPNVRRILEGKNIEVLPPEEIARRIKINRDRVSKANLAIVLTEEDAGDEKIWNGSLKERGIPASILVLQTRLTDSNYLYLQGVIKLAWAMLSKDRAAILSLYNLLTGQTLDTRVLNPLDDDKAISFILKAILKSIPINKNDPAALPKNKELMEKYLMAA